MDPQPDEPLVLPEPEVLDQMDARIYQVAMFRAAFERSSSARCLSGCPRPASR